MLDSRCLCYAWGLGHVSQFVDHRCRGVEAIFRVTRDAAADYLAQLRAHIEAGDIDVLRYSVHEHRHQIPFWTRLPTGDHLEQD